MSNFFVALAVFLITVVGALFTVPYFIDWNGYRGVFEEEASRMLGREVRVGGAVNLHLLPTPYFRFEKVRIADASVNLEEPFFRAESLTVKLSVPPLLKGAVEANEIEFQRPVLRLAADAKGGWNWQSFVQAFGDAPYMPSNVVLTSLKIKDGVLALHGVDGIERTRIEGLEGELSSPALEGPYRFRGTFGTAGAERELRLATAKAEGDGTVRFRASLRLVDVGSVYTLDSRLVDLMGKPRMDGELTARLPVSSIWQTAAKPNSSTHAKGSNTPEDAKSALAGDVAFDLKAAVAADAAGATLSDLALSFEQDGRPQLLTGGVKATWRDALAVDISLASRWLDLDRIAGVSEGSSPLESIVPLAVRLRDLLPAEGRSRASFTVDQANIAREAISGLRLSLVRSKDKLEVEELKLGMPGNSRGELRGVVSGPLNALAFDGTVGVRGASIVRFLGWARGAAFPADTKGDGTFGVRSRLSIAPGQLTLRDVVGDLSGTTLYGRAHYRWEGRPEISIAAEGPQFDLRPFVAEGASLHDLFNLALGASESGTGGATQTKRGWRGGQTDALVRLNAGQLTTAGRTYRDVALELDLKGGNLRVPLLRLSGEEGYSLELEGEVDDIAGRPKGSLRAVAAVESQQGLLPLAELIGVPNGLRPGERRLQGATPLRVAGSMVFGSRTATSSDILIDGEANGSSVKASLRLDGNAAGWRRGLADLTGSLEGPDAGRIVAALLGSGSPSGGDSVRPGRILIKAGGLPSEGLTAIASAEAGDLSLAYRGNLALQGTGNRIAGELEIKGADGARLASMAGLPSALKLDGLPVSGILTLKADSRAIDVERLALSIGGSNVRGSLTLSQAGERRRLAATLLVEELSIARLLTPVLDQRLAITGAVEAVLSGQQSLWPDDAFDMAALDALEGSVKLEAARLVLTGGVSLGQAAFDIALAPGRIVVNEVTGTGLGGRFSARFAIDKRPGGCELAGTASFDGMLESLASTRAGSPPRTTGPLKGNLELSGRGNSPRALISALQGKATIEVGEAKLGNLWPGALGAAVEAAVKVEADRVGPMLRQRLLEALAEGQLPLGPAALAVDIVDGQLRSKPMLIETDQGRATGSANLDLRSLAFDSEWRLERKRVNDRIDQKTALPAVIVQYRGSAAALHMLEVRVLTEALERELTARKMEIDLEDLERQRQQDETRRRSEAERLREQPDQRGIRPTGPNTPLQKGNTQGAPG